MLKHLLSPSAFLYPSLLPFSTSHSTTSASARQRPSPRARPLLELGEMGWGSARKRKKHQDSDLGQGAAVVAEAELGAKEHGLRQLLDKRCPVGDFKDDDIKKLVEHGFNTEAALAGATESLLVGVLPARLGVVAILLKEFVKPAELLEPSPPIQQFVRSAGRNFLAYEQNKLLAVPGDSQEKSKFLAVCGNLLGSLPTTMGFLIWIRKCYEDLMRILIGAKENEKFIFQGTAGVGKSVFTLVWISYLATQRKKVVFKSTLNEFYLLDFTLVEAKAFGPYKHVGHLDLRDVLFDVTAWLILDGNQREVLGYPCHMLLACSTKKANYHEFAKQSKCRVRYVPVWTEEEVKEFLVDFEPHRSVYGHMSMPDKGTVMKNFQLFGGVPRCVLDCAKSDIHGQSLRTAIQELDMDTCLKLFAGSFGDDDADKLVHMKCLDDTYSEYQYDFASQFVLEQIWQHLQLKTKLDTIHYLEELLRRPTSAAAFGSMFKLVAHSLVAHGGNFKMKRVSKDKKPEAMDDLKLEKSEKKVFEELGDLLKFQDGVYCLPKKKNLQSVDAVILPNTLLQFFHYTQGNHGYKIKGLQDLDGVLRKTEYRLISCVPQDTYDSTGFQNFLDGKGKQKRRLAAWPGEGLLQVAEQWIKLSEMRNQIGTIILYNCREFPIISFSLLNFCRACPTLL